MRTERLYYDDPWLLRFEALVLDVSETGEGPAVVLDRTAFHPTGGGQPHDTGRLGGCRVVDVVADADGTIRHRLESPPPFVPGATIEGEVDARRRRDHLQQHSGQHLLSAAFVRAVGAATRSFHLGPVVSTIDLDRSPEDLGDWIAVEDLANRVIAEDRPMTARIVAEEEARALPLRKELPIEGRVRIVSIDEFDMTPCGGTHARRAGEIGMLAILGVERHRGGARVEFVAGDRVRRALHRANDEARALGERLSAPEGDRVEALDRLLQERRDGTRRAREMAARAASMESALLAAEARDGLLARALGEREADEVGSLARGLADRGLVALLAFTQEGAGRVVVAGPGEPPLGALLQEAGARFGLRGGGGPRFAQGGGVPPEQLAELLVELERRLRPALPA